MAADWLGHTETVADKHYRQTTREHFERANNGITKANPSGTLLVALHCGASQSIAEQNPNKPAASKPSRNAEKSKKSGFAPKYKTAKLDDTRLELVTSTMSTCSLFGNL